MNGEDRIRTRCRVCGHPGLSEINLMLINDTTYPAIIRKMKRLHPTAPLLTPTNLSRHKTDHVLSRPVKVDEVDPETGEAREAFIVGHLAQYRAIPKHAIPPPEEQIALPDALMIILHLGITNMLNRPELVKPRDALDAAELLRKLGEGGRGAKDFEDAWKALGAKKGEDKRKQRRRKTTVTVEEETVTVEPDAPATDIIDGEAWSAEELQALEEPTNGTETTPTSKRLPNGAAI